MVYFSLSFQHESPVQNPEKFVSFCNGQPHLLLTAGTSWEWIRDELKADPSTQTPIGRYMDADLEEVVCRQP